MTNNQLKTLQFIKNMTGAGLLIGLIVFIASIFVSGIISAYVLSIGLSIMISSMLIFGFGLFINLMEEMTEGSRGVR